MYLFGYLSIACVTTGLVFKLQHWTGAGIMLVHAAASGGGVVVSRRRLDSIPARLRFDLAGRFYILGPGIQVSP